MKTNVRRKKKTQARSDPTTSPPPDRMLRVKQVLDLVPISRSAWWRGVKEGQYPKPYKIGPRVSVWSEKEIHSFMRRVLSGKTK